ncbi:hypothetical protein SprV_0501809000 [Sparganum proliferum]
MSVCMADATAAEVEAMGKEEEDGCGGWGGGDQRRSVSDEIIPVGRVDLRTPQGGLQSVFLLTDLASLAAGARGDISMEESFGWPLIVYPQEVAAPTQLRLHQHGVDAENFRPLQNVSVGDQVLLPQLQYPSKTAEVEVVDVPRPRLVDRPGLCSIRQCLQDHCLVHLQLRIEMKTVRVPNGVLQAEVVKGGVEEFHAPLHVPFGGGVVGSVVGEEEFMNGSCGYTRLEVYPPVAEEAAVGSVGDANPGTFVVIYSHQHDREHKTEEGRREDAALLNTVGHCECL